MQEKLRLAVEELREATTAATTPVLRRNLINKLEKCAKYAASTATQCVAASSGVGPYNTNTTIQTELNIECRSMVQYIPNLVSGIKGTLAQPENPTMQLNLINASEQFLQPGLAVVKAAKAAIPTITDQALVLQLNNSAQNLGSALTDLKSTTSRAKEACIGLDLDAAEEAIIGLKEELEELQKAVETSTLKPLPDETAKLTSLKLGAVSKTVESAMAQLLSAAKQGNENYTGSAARETSATLRDFIAAVRGVAATVMQRDTQCSVLLAADDVLHKSIILIREARRILKNPNNTNNEINLAAIVKEVSHALNTCVSCLPSQKDIDKAIQNIQDISHILKTENYPATNKTYRYVIPKFILFS